MQIRERIYEIVEVAKGNDRVSRVFDIYITLLICLNIGVVIIETVKSVETHFTLWLRAFDVASALIFTVEYLLRLWSCTADPRYADPIRGRIRYALTPMALIDLVAVLPFYLPLVLPLDLRVVRAFRLFRLLRVLKLSRYSESMRVLGNVIRNKKEELFICLFTGMILLIVSSSVMYFVETEAQPENFSSIPGAMWWGVATLTTVGYGDIYPVTPLGRLIGAAVSILGIGMFALPAGILASGFAEEIRRNHSRDENGRENSVVCPHCGMEINIHH